MRFSPQDLQEKMSGKTDEDLYNILHTHSQDYTPETIEAAREEI
jgi:hypothetical protein